jgi:hypothetical protein
MPTQFKVDDTNIHLMEKTVPARLDNIGALARANVKAEIEPENYTGNEPAGMPLNWKCSMSFTKHKPMPDNKVLESALFLLGQQEDDRDRCRLFNVDTLTPMLLGDRYSQAKDTPKFQRDKIIVTQDVYDSFVDAAFAQINDGIRKKPGFEKHVISKTDKSFDSMPFKHAFGAPIEIGSENIIHTYKGSYNPFDELLKVKYKVRNGMTFVVKSRADFYRKVPKNEWTAVETLREMITEREFRKYLSNGFLLVKGLSGRVYQIFRNNKHTKVWDKGELIEEVCVRIRDKDIPPTDNVIAFKTIIETCEEEFRKLGNVYNMRKKVA